MFTYSGRLFKSEYRNAEQRIHWAIREHETLIESLERAIARGEHEEGARHEQEL